MNRFFDKEEGDRRAFHLFGYQLKLTINLECNHLKLQPIKTHNKVKLNDL